MHHSRNIPLSLALVAALALLSALAVASPASALEQKLTASDAAASDMFGSSVAIDGDTLVVGAPGERNENGNGRGAVYVYQRSGNSWTQTAKLTATDGANLGSSVAIDGDTIVAGDKANAVGPVGGGHGAVYTFARTGAADRTETAKLTASDGDAAEYLGTSVAIDGDTIVAGAPLALVGRNEPEGGIHAGAAYTFARTGAAARTETAKLTASDGASIDQLGTSVAIDGDTIVAGAPYDNATNSNEGSVYTFARTGAAARTETAKLTASDTAGEDVIGLELGFSVAIDGDTIFAGAPADDVAVSNQGSVYTFARTGAAARTETAKLTASDGGTPDRLGWSVAIDGDTIVAGAPGVDHGPNNQQQGSAYTFARTGAATRTETAKLTASDGEANDNLSYSVAIDGDMIVAGTPFDNFDTIGTSNDRGSVSVFLDSDLDGVPDASDSCLLGAAVGLDTDGDGCKDEGEDDDDDNDAVADVSDACPTTVGPASNAGCPDTIAPVTTIDETKINQRTRKATFEFSSNEPNSTFRCKLDSNPYRDCGSPKAYQNVKPGGHTFKVQADDEAGNRDPTPGVKQFRINR